MNVAWTAYRILAPCLGALAPAARVFASPLERPLWRERLGVSDLEGGCHAWIHAASLGEAQAVGPLARELVVLQPRARLYLTAHTRAGRARLGEFSHPTSLAPIDAPQAVRRFFAGVRPARMIVVETELWPHWLMRARAEGVPVAIVSARLSERSVERYRRLGEGMRRLVGGLAAVLCQSEGDARRWNAIGSPPERTEVTGNLKHDRIPEAPPSRAASRLALGLDPERPLLVLGSVRPGEVRLCARAWSELPEPIRRHWQVVVVPRHARAADELEDEAVQAGLTVRHEGFPSGNAWRWDGRSGVLNAYYAAADVAFVGGSLLPYGGHNPIEPAAAGAAVLMGAHHASQLESVRQLEAQRAIWIVATPEQLGEGLRHLIESPEERARQSRAGYEVVTALRGAARRTAARLATLGFWPAE